MDPSRIVELASAFYGSCVLFTASDLGVFECLARSPGMTAAALARERGLDTRAAGLLLVACAALALVGMDGGQ